jgi:epsilon-lactone hydrolase
MKIVPRVRLCHLRNCAIASSSATRPLLRDAHARRDQSVAVPAAKLWADGLPLVDPRISPLFGDQTHLPPTLLFVGTNDILLSDAHRLMSRGAKVTLREYPGMFHVWVGAPIPEAKRALDEAAASIDTETHTSR